MRSLHSRLIALLLTISAAGLVVLGAITYAEQRSFLNQRVDQQAQAATRAAGHVLGNATMPDDDRPPGGGGKADTVPSGTYGQLRDAGGRVVAAGFLFSYTSTSATAAPKLPAGIRDGDTFTLTSSG